jgi:hypothetical protein
MDPLSPISPPRLLLQWLLLLLQWLLRLQPQGW